MRNEMFCDHCCEEPAVPDNWPHEHCCPACAEAGHTTGREVCRACDKAFRDKMEEIANSIDARVIRDGLICVRPEGYPHLRLGCHYKVEATRQMAVRGETRYWVRVIDDSGEATDYPAECFRSLREDETPRNP